MINALTIHRGVALLTLAGIAVLQFTTFHRTPGLERYQGQIRVAANLMPSRIGPWVGDDVAVPVRALTVLQPNVLISRRYLNVESGMVAGLLLVHCDDAHSMVGHFPLRCYPAEGWQLRSSEPRDWVLGELRLTGTEYAFTMDDVIGGQHGARSIIVANCLLRPGGLVLRDMDSMSDSIIGADGQASGAGQIQVYFDARVPSARREAAIVELLSGYRPVIDAILSRPGPK
jgi:Protein of unknown function (DUF3485)